MSVKIKQTDAEPFEGCDNKQILKNKVRIKCNDIELCEIVHKYNKVEWTFCPYCGIELK